MGSKDGSNSGFGTLERENTCTGHPFVELCNHTLVRHKVIIDKMVDHLTCCITEESGLYKIPLTAERVQPELLPKSGKNIILLLNELGKINQNCNGISRHTPPADSYNKTISSGSQTPGT